MRNKFEEQLEQLHVELIRMGALCEDAISAAAEALLERDPKLASAAAGSGTRTWPALISTTG